MNRLNTVFLKVVRWTGWFLVPLAVGFLLTGYGISGRYGLGSLLTEQTALTLHKLFHLPLVVLLLGHVLPAGALALQRWGWIRQQSPPIPPGRPE
jgi:hypothetical protein